MAGRVFPQLRGLRGASLVGIGAARVEPAAGGRIDGAGDVALQHDALAGLVLLRVRQGHRGEQGLGVGVDGVVG